MVRWWIFGYDWTRYVTVDIAKDLDSKGVQITGNWRDKQYGTHYYKDGNSTVYLQESPFNSLSLQGYCRFVHTLQPDTHTYRYLLKEVQYNGTPQSIPESIESTHSVTVVYLCHDKGRKIPLMICLLKYPGYSRYLRHYIHYYVREDGLFSDKWIRDSKVTTYGKVLTEKLKEIVGRCNYPSILNAEKASGSYCIDGGDAKGFKHYSIPKFSVKKSENDPVQGYVKYTHVLGSRYKFRIFSTIHKNEYQKFTDKDFYKRGPFEEASFYYWEGDKTYQNPLLLELGCKSTSYKSYYILEKDTWINITVFKSIFDGKVLVDVLDAENCKKNHAVVLDISQTYENNFLRFDYPCYTNITVTRHNGGSAYDGYHHSLKGGHKIGRFAYGLDSATLNPLEFPLTDTSVFVFHCCNCEDKKLSLIYLKNTNKLYKNSKEKPYEWNIHNETITSEDDKDRIEKILKEDATASTNTTSSSAKEEDTVNGVEKDDVPAFEDESNPNGHNPNLWHLLWLVPIIILIILLILYCYYYYLRDPWVRQI
ncbi:hypothetical protein BEWA_041070 [Theileria equi strain WA]|uniref:Uncharacterized protein n=1 Tax=Theileria equi strain WA TaxID=1537102 RepID=L1LFM1_THEEQ|nr:hypothetical protein BEWA_041070 [Theileria equi strain WA]EKX74069.1 hypothetical protein BEWA_041070 [Theileria equi strain WA]|eukprot:XP_004833521.1 hypothetical protein BEWA_041070 [Theileria equi strain WA]